MHVWDAGLGTVLSVSLHVFSAIIIYSMWRKLSPKPENVEWQGIWRGLGKRLEVWGPLVSWDFTLEHLWDPEKRSKYLSQGWCGLGRPEEGLFGALLMLIKLYTILFWRERVSELRFKPKGEISKSNLINHRRHQ